MRLPLRLSEPTAISRSVRDTRIRDLYRHDQRCHLRHFLLPTEQDTRRYPIAARHLRQPEWRSTGAYQGERSSKPSRSHRSANCSTGADRAAPFAMMERNAIHVSDFFSLPNDQVVEIGRQIAI